MSTNAYCSACTRSTPVVLVRRRPVYPNRLQCCISTGILERIAGSSYWLLMEYDYSYYNQSAVVAKPGNITLHFSQSSCQSGGNPLHFSMTVTQMGKASGCLRPRFWCVSVSSRKVSLLAPTKCHLQELELISPLL